MNLTRVSHILVGVALFLRHPPERNERGLSQSVENAVLLTGVIIVALLVIKVITAYVTKNLPK